MCFTFFDFETFKMMIMPETKKYFKLNNKKIKNVKPLYDNIEIGGVHTSSIHALEGRTHQCDCDIWIKGGDRHASLTLNHFGLVLNTDC